MAERDIKNIDFNLLHVFDVIMTEGTLTRAGRRLGMTQSAVSHAVARLRDLIDDPLFERGRRGVEPTPRALELAPTIRRAVGLMRGAFEPAVAFEPAKSTRMFVLELPVGLDSIVLPRLQEMVASFSGLSFRIFAGRSGESAAAPYSPASQVTLDHAPASVAGFRSECLFEDPFAVVARRRHPAMDGPMTKATYARLDHVALTWVRGFGPSPLDTALAEQGLARRTRISVPHISSMPNVLVGSDLIATLPLRIANAIAKTAPLATCALDFEVRPQPIFMSWHASADEDEGHVWLRETMRRIVARF